MTIALLLIIILLCGAILYAHRKHADALTEVKNVFASMRADFNRLRAKVDGGTIPK